MTRAEAFATLRRIGSMNENTWSPQDEINAASAVVDLAEDFFFQIGTIAASLERIAVVLEQEMRE